MRENVDPSRRQFLGSVGAGAAGLVAAGFGATASGFPANETLRVGLIGCGGRMQGALAPALKEIAGLKIVAVCDIWDAHIAKGKSFAEPDALATRDHRAVLDLKDVDAVVIATPDHWHSPLAIEACQAGKDVYVEKPLTHDLSEGKAVVEAQNRHKRIVQVGMQQRSMPQFVQGLEVMKSGDLGEIHRVHVSWNRNAPPGRNTKLEIPESSLDWKRFLGSARAQPFDPYRFRSWRWFWDFGGGIFTDLMVHFIDVAHWYLGLDHPAKALSLGEHYQAKGVWETPDTVSTLLDYPDQGVQIFFEGTFFNARNAAHLEFQGTKASLYLDRGRMEVIPERGAGPTREFRPGTGARGADFDPAINCGLMHMTNWVECVRSRKTPSAPAEAGVSACNPAHLANKALREGGMAKWA